MPLVSVITPNFGSFERIERCHQIVRMQTLTDWEHIIVDDGSGQNTGEKLRAFAETDSRIVPVIANENRGAGAARNLGLNAATGHYIAFLDVDDHWDREKLETQVDFMQSHGVGLCHGSYRIAESEKADKKRYRAQHPPDRVTHAQLLNGCSIGCLTVMIEASLLRDVEFQKYRRGQDWSLWLLLTANGQHFEKFPGLCCTYTRRSGTLSSNKLRKLIDVWRIYREQESLSVPKAIWCLMRHAHYVLLRPEYRYHDVHLTKITKQQ
tara:strand:- start:25198 stop:25995 length:798 start_codon:yes stop_codon:yes gene_type:complete